MTSPPEVRSLLDLSGRVAIVTGASGNIGAGIARRLLEAGASVVVHGHANASAAEELAEELGRQAVVALGDVERDAGAICRRAVEAFGSLDVVVNNAGIQPVAPLGSIGAEEAAEMLRVNVGGVIAMTREAAASMGERGGSIVNVASIEGLQPAFDTVWSNDNSAKKAAVFKANFGDSGFALGNIQQVKGASLPAADLAWASFPCQDLSLAGNLRGIQQGTRSGLFWEWMRVLDEASGARKQPRLLVAENVVGFLVANEGADFRVAYQALRSRGYVAGALAIDARHFVPQSRPRAFLVAAREGTDLRGLIQPGPSEPFHSASVIRAARAVADPDWIWWSLPLPSMRIQSLASLFESDVQGELVDRKEFESWLSPANLEKVRVISRLGRQTVGTAYKRTRPSVEKRKKTRLELRFDGFAGCLRTPKGGSSRQLLVTVDKGQVRTRLLTVRECARPRVAQR